MAEWSGQQPRVQVLLLHRATHHSFLFVSFFLFFLFCSIVLSPITTRNEVVRELGLSCSQGKIYQIRVPAHVSRSTIRI